MKEVMQSDPTIYAIPVFIVLILIELAIDIKRKLHIYELKDSMACISMGIGVVIIGLLTKTVAYFGYDLIYQYRFFSLPNTWWMWVALLFADDFSFYWHHRLSHTVRILWAAHSQHHSSQRMNLSVALRQSWGEPFYKYIFWAWIPLLGFSPLNIMIMQSISLIYQFFQHTELVKKLGPLEWVFNTPSHHRVHHAVQPQYLDRNHAGIFIIWDRLFGTFEEEDFSDKPVYGLTHNLTSFNPLVIATDELKHIWQDVKRAPRFSDKLKYVFYPPGWTHDGEVSTSSIMRAKWEKSRE